jgi:hypothetical protein
MSELKDTAAQEAREVTRGRTWHTPFTTLGSVAVVVWGVAAIVIAVALILWLSLR